ncbi:hypothetical protein TVAG_076720 [Trichomonas vaginalis G3]|uniref:Fringe-like glycosyltransferase domain-containing protein n=1 Tax=Trichomonas vaginalis (strain ATCC PRA-98 / G3) TaxID=412133 RepID=A2D9R9_TRIV3|nr:fringe-like family [Trichomonas vaginalis G3]EAY22925.1 hypothetical protein TVAG_076720 [Trichomonas vaginalis G3]KAI5527349.1 fringe-like family [Trichomonas vaginalis G3]|eukprot:XP_001583911.1 hypothetical protein [Trichomonas vaginalis G3]
MHDFAFGIWTGKKMIKSRILPLAKTWLKFVPSIDIYSDYLDMDDVYEVLNSSNHLNITFHTIPTFAHHLVGTNFDNVWNHAQSRHLIAFSDLYRRYPNKKWYFLGDDDTFLFPNGIIKNLKDFNYTEQRILGHQFAIFPSLIKFYQSNQSNYYFCQGGAGFFVSQAMMKFLGPRILNCSKYYEAFNFVSDIRISACIDFYSTINNISTNYSNYIDQIGLINGDLPEKSTSKGSPDNQPISYHHSVDKITELIWNSSFSTWTYKNGTDVFVEWTHVFGSHITTEIAYEGNFMDIIWGYMIYAPYGNNYYSETPPEPVFSSNESEIPYKYIQNFQNNITFEYICDDNLKHGSVVFDHFLGEGKEGTSFRVHCDPPKPYMHNFPNGSPLSLLHEDQSDL